MLLTAKSLALNQGAMYGMCQTSGIFCLLERCLLLYFIFVFKALLSNLNVLRFGL